MAYQSFKQLYSWGVRGLAGIGLFALVSCGENQKSNVHASALPVIAQYDTLRGRVDAEFTIIYEGSNNSDSAFRIVTPDSAVIYINPIGGGRVLSQLVQAGDNVAILVPHDETIKPIYDIKDEDVLEVKRSVR